MEEWFYEHAVHPRTLKDRLDRNEPLKDSEADRFERLTPLLARARETFQDENKAMVWLKSHKKAFAGATQRAGIGCNCGTGANAAYRARH